MDEEAIFAAALEKSTPAERDAFLDRACSGNPELRENLASLLEAYGDGEFLESPSRLAVTLDSPPVAERPGAIIGRYKLLQEIGEGGMGVVYMAEQQRARPPQGRPEDHQAGHGHQGGHRPLRGRAAGPGPDGPPQHRPGARRRRHRVGPALLRHGAGPRACPSPSTATRPT